MCVCLVVILCGVVLTFLSRRLLGVLYVFAVVCFLGFVFVAMWGFCVLFFCLRALSCVIFFVVYFVVFRVGCLSGLVFFFWTCVLGAVLWRLPFVFVVWVHLCVVFCTVSVVGVFLFIGGWGACYVCVWCGWVVYGLVV